jgi:protein ImuA
VSASRKIFPAGLETLGVRADRFIFLDVKKEKDVRWVMDEALKCNSLTAVVGEMRSLSFTESRKLQLAVEQSQVTGFILRHNPRALDANACVSRWRVTSLPSESIEDLPGIGFPKWKVELLRMRNGKAGTWDIQCRNGRLVTVESPRPSIQHQERKAG